jgi:hypothetical protein
MKFEYTKEEIARRAFNTGHEDLQSEDLINEDTEIPATDQNRVIWALNWRVGHAQGQELRTAQKLKDAIK